MWQTEKIWWFILIALASLRGKIISLVLFSWNFQSKYNGHKIKLIKIRLINQRWLIDQNYFTEVFNWSKLFNQLQKQIRFIFQTIEIRSVDFVQFVGQAMKRFYWPDNPQLGQKDMLMLLVTLGIMLFFCFCFLKKKIVEKLF